MIPLILDSIQNCNIVHNSHKPQLCILGDIGGTNTRLHLVSLSSPANNTELSRQFYKSNDYDTFNLVLQQFFTDQKIDPKTIQLLVLCLAGPVQNNSQCKLSNLKWPELNVQHIQAQFNIRSVFLNDFEAIGYSVLSEKLQQQMLKLNDCQLTQNKNISVFGPGTGLGTCLLTHDGKNYNIYPSEGGHVELSTIDQFDWHYKQYLQQITQQTHISVERAFCGPAIPDIYNYICKINNQQPQTLTNQQILQLGKTRQDQICNQVVDFMIKMMAIEISNLAVRTVCYSGLYLVNNIINELKEYIIETKDTLFLKYYYSKPLMKHVLEKVPIFIILYPELGYLGCQINAARYFN